MNYQKWELFSGSPGTLSNDVDSRHCLREAFVQGNFFEERRAHISQVPQCLPKCHTLLQLQKEPKYGNKVHHCGMIFALYRHRMQHILLSCLCHSLLVHPWQNSRYTRLHLCTSADRREENFLPVVQPPYDCSSIVYCNEDLCVC